MDDQITPSPEPEEPEPAPGEPQTSAETAAEPLRRPRGLGILRPWEALERLDRQWEDRTPLAELEQPITALALTTDDDPRGWDYLGALTGASARETADACEAWLEAQLAADAAALGRALRPRVDLVPSGRLWFVVRTVAEITVVIDGPGFLTPRAAAIAASRRYRAELLRELERVSDRSVPAVNDDPADGPSEDGPPEGVEDETDADPTV